MTRLVPLRPRANFLARSRHDGKSERRNGSAQTRRIIQPMSPLNTSSSRNLAPRHLRLPTPQSPACPVTAPYDTSQVPPMQPPYGSSSYIFTRRHLRTRARARFHGPMPYYPVQLPSATSALPPQHHGMGLTPRVPELIHRLLACLALLHHPQQWYIWAPFPWANPTSGAPPASHPGTPSLQHHHSFTTVSIGAGILRHSMGGFNVPTYFHSIGPMHAPSRGSNLSNSQHTLSAWRSCRRAMTSAFAYAANNNE